MYWLPRRSFTPSLANKGLVYLVILWTGWTYGLQLWRLTAALYTAFKIKSCALTIGASWLIRGEQVHADLAYCTSGPEMHQEYARRHELRLHKHINWLALDLLNTTQSFNSQDATLSICFRIVVSCSNPLISLCDVKS